MATDTDCARVDCCSRTQPAQRAWPTGRPITVVPTFVAPLIEPYPLGLWADLGARPTADAFPAKLAYAFFPLDARTQRARTSVAGGRKPTTPLRPGVFRRDLVQGFHTGRLLRHVHLRGVGLTAGPIAAGRFPYEDNTEGETHVC